MNEIWDDKVDRITDTDRLAAEKARQEALIEATQDFEAELVSDDDTLGTPYVNFSLTGTNGVNISIMVSNLIDDEEDTIKTAGSAALAALILMHQAMAELGDMDDLGD